MSEEDTKRSIWEAKGELANYFALELFQHMIAYDVSKKKLMSFNSPFFKLYEIFGEKNGSAYYYSESKKLALKEKWMEVKAVKKTVSELTSGIRNIYDHDNDNGFISPWDTYRYLTVLSLIYPDMPPDASSRFTEMLDINLSLLAFVAGKHVQDFYHEGRQNINRIYKQKIAATDNKDKQKELLLKILERPLTETENMSKVAETIIRRIEKKYGKAIPKQLQGRKPGSIIGKRTIINTLKTSDESLKPTE